MKKKEVKVVLSLGSNLEPRREHLKKGIRKIRSLKGVRVKRVSSPYETPPFQLETGANDFLNCIVICEVQPTKWDPLEFLSRLKEIEKESGRPLSEKGKRLSRTLDIDIVFWGKSRMRTAELTIPHPQYSQRIFVLKPLMECGWGRFRTPDGKVELRKLLRKAKSLPICKVSW